MTAHVNDALALMTDDNQALVFAAVAIAEEIHTSNLIHAFAVGIPQSQKQYEDMRALIAGRLGDQPAQGGDR